ncbi:hypothetical protein HOY80DRAFT_1041241 [Tuber brumale]|nr:hypothetical protein HOY80DRAFT_1041241 [Tuber brumale]
MPWSWFTAASPFDRRGHSVLSPLAVLLFRHSAVLSFAAVPYRRSLFVPRRVHSYTVPLFGGGHFWLLQYLKAIKVVLVFVVSPVQKSLLFEKHIKKAKWQ